MDEAFSVPRGAKTFRYCSQEEYEGGEEYVNERRPFENIIKETVRYIVEADELVDSSYDPLVFKWLQIVSVQILKDFLCEKKVILAKQIAKKNIETVERRLKYLNGIICSSIGEYTLQREKRSFSAGDINQNSEMYAPRLTPRKGMRRSMEELEDIYGDTSA